MLTFSHRLTFGLCVSVIALTAIVVATATLALHKHQDNNLLYRHIDDLKTENAALRERLRQYTATQDDAQQQLAPQKSTDSVSEGGGSAAGS